MSGRTGRHENTKCGVLVRFLYTTRMGWICLGEVTRPQLMKINARGQSGSQIPGSVIYACLGSLSDMLPSQLIELGLSLEASNRPFILVMRRTAASEEVENWILEDGFEERTKGRGLVIRGWAPQLLQIGVKVGVEDSLTRGEELKVGVLVKKEDVKKAIKRWMEEGKEGEERQNRAKKLGEMAMKALQVGRYSHLNITQLIQDIMQRTCERKLSST
ncbi:hypothetical protein DITRI_Ditri20bG0079700 [Diplodiscus trichospermus]